MPYISETEHAELMRLRLAADDVRSHVAAWVGLLSAHAASLPPDRPDTAEEAGCADRSYAEHELRAMKRDLAAIAGATAYRRGSAMEVGDRVVPVLGNRVAPIDREGVLAIGASRYACAIVASVEPFYLISEEGDMLWHHTVDRQDFTSTGPAEGEVIVKVLERLARDEAAETAVGPQAVAALHALLASPHRPLA